jgi:hypothetical protein
MFKKKNRIVVNARVDESTTTYVPEFMGNMDLDEGDRTSFVLRKLSNVDRMDLLKVDDKQQVHEDKERFLRLGIDKVVNPPIIEIDGKERDMTIDDLVGMEELFVLAMSVFAKIVEFNRRRIDSGK